MSDKYWNSPALRLDIGRSRLRQVLYLALCLWILEALFLTSQRGYTEHVLVMMPLVLLLLLRLAPYPAQGVQLRWHRGDWCLSQHGVSQTIIPLERSVRTRWAICLAFERVPSRQRAWLWIFSDSVEAADLRRLRVRLALARADN